MARQYRIPKTNVLLALAAGAAEAYPATLEREAEEEYREKVLGLREKEMEEAKRGRMATQALGIARLWSERQEAKAGREYGEKMARLESELTAGRTESAARLQAELEKDLIKERNPYLKIMAMLQLKEKAQDIELARKGFDLTKEQFEEAKRRNLVLESLGFREAEYRDSSLKLQAAISNKSTEAQFLLKGLDAWLADLSSKGFKFNDAEKETWNSFNLLLEGALKWDDETYTKTAAEFLPKVREIAARGGVDFPIDKMEWKDGFWNWVPLVRDKGKPLIIKTEEGPAAPAGPPAPETPTPSFFDLFRQIQQYIPRVEETEEGFGLAELEATGLSENADKIWNNLMKVPKAERRAVFESQLEDLRGVISDAEVEEIRRRAGI